MFIFNSCIKLLSGLIKAWSKQDESWWKLVRVATLASVWPPPLINSHPLWTGSNFDESLCTFDQTVVDNSHQLSPRLIGAWKLRELSRKLSLLNSHQLSSSFDEAFTLRKIFRGEGESCTWKSWLLKLFYFKYHAIYSFIFSLRMLSWLKNYNYSFVIQIDFQISSKAFKKYWIIAPLSPS